MRRETGACVAAMVLSLALRTGLALGQRETRPESTDLAPRRKGLTDPPWSVGVKPENRARAQELLGHGNELLKQRRYADALEVYGRALQAWDHPAIHANMVICFINLEKRLEAYQSAERALRYGAAPFDKPGVYDATRNYQRLLESQVGFVDVRCEERGVQVTLDGQKFVECPGVSRRFVLVGTHQLVAQKPGYLTITRDFMTRGQDIESVAPRLVSLPEEVRESSFNRAGNLSLMITGGGAVALVTGNLLHTSAARSMRRYENYLRKNCMRGGCTGSKRPPQHVLRLGRTAKRKDRVAIPMMGSGIVAVAAGLVFLILKGRGTDAPAAEEGGSWQVRPALTPDSAGASLELTF